MKKTKTLVLFFLFLNGVPSNSKNDQVEHFRLGDRIYLTRTLKGIFGKASEPIINQGIFNQFHIFGAPCDPYSQHLKPTEKGYSAEGGYQRCHNKFFLEYRTPILIPSSPLRSGAMIKTCEQLVDCSDCLEHALKKAQVEKNAFNISKGGKKLYRLFYPFRSEEEWENLLRSFKENQNYWDPKKTLRLFCISEGWQTL